MNLRATNPEAGRTILMLAFSLSVLFCLMLAGCKNTREAPKETEKPATTSEGTHPAVAGSIKEAPPIGQPPKLTTMHPVTLKSLNITEDNTHNATRFQIVASGDFVFNIVTKASPERLVVIIHNADRGKAPDKIPVHNGIVNGVEIKELETGKGKAVSITINLTKRTKYISNSANGVLVINVFKKA